MVISMEERSSGSLRAWEAAPRRAEGGDGGISCTKKARRLKDEP